MKVLPENNAEVNMDEFDSLESEDEKVEYLFNLLKPVLEKTAGRLRHVKKDEEVQCSGKYEGRSVRIIMDASTGGLKVEMKIRNTAGIIRILYDPDAEPEDHGPDAEWDSGEEQRFFMAPGFYIENYPDRLASEKKVLETLDPQELKNITALMRRLGIGWVYAESGLLSCGLFESLFDGDEISGIIQALHRFAVQFEKEGDQVPAGPSVILGGAEINPELVPAFIVCPFCNSKVTAGRNRKCPNCGAGL